MKHIIYNFIFAKSAYGIRNGKYMYENYSIMTEMNYIEVHTAREFIVDEMCQNLYHFNKKLQNLG